MGQPLGVRFKSARTRARAVVASPDRLADLEAGIRDLRQLARTQQDTLALLSAQNSALIEGIANVRDAVAVQALQTAVASLGAQIDDLRESAARERIAPLLWRLVAQREIALTTNDHLHPRGTKNDNTRHPAFVRACEQILSIRPLTHLDLGCAGGGLVWDFSWRGHLSAGIEGSDYSLRRQRAEWRTIPDRLFTADICYPFHFEQLSDGAEVCFDVISAWELFEHIPELKLEGLLSNLRRNLKSEGLVVGSIATYPDSDEETGVVYHHTVQPRNWWLERFAAGGLYPADDAFPAGSFVRGSGNPTSPDWDADTEPERGFHVVLRRG